jgi:hypothetical protein
MDRSPFRTQRSDRRRQRPLNPVQIGQSETVTFTQCRWSTRAMQIEYRLAIRPLYMDMSRSMVVRPDHDPQAADVKDGGHNSL